MGVLWWVFGSERTCFQAFQSEQGPFQTPPGKKIFSRPLADEYARYNKDGRSNEIYRDYPIYVATYELIDVARRYGVPAALCKEPPEVWRSLKHIWIQISNYVEIIGG